MGHETLASVLAARLHAAALGLATGPPGGRAAALRARRQRQPAHCRLGMPMPMPRLGALTLLLVLRALVLYSL